MSTFYRHLKIISNNFKWINELIKQVFLERLIRRWKLKYSTYVNFNFNYKVSQTWFSWKKISLNDIESNVIPLKNHFNLLLIKEYESLKNLIHFVIFVQFQFSYRSRIGCKAKKILLSKLINIVLLHFLFLEDLFDKG